MEVGTQDTGVGTLCPRVYPIDEEIVEIENGLAAFVRTTKVRLSSQHPAKDTAKAKIPDDISGYAYRKEGSQNDVAPATETETETVPSNPVVVERSTVETI